jgi:hypothetical protein
VELLNELLVQLVMMEQMEDLAHSVILLSLVEVEKVWVELLVLIVLVGGEVAHLQVHQVQHEVLLL